MKVFKEPPTSRHQLYFLPPSLNELVPIGSRARIISDTIDGMDSAELMARYRGGGAPAYDPRMLLKVMLFGYSEGIRSSRRIEERCERDTHYMFLAEMSKPDHRTICRFRRDNEAAIKKLFLETVLRCQAAGLVLLRHVAVDGTKIEANVSSKETYNRERVEKAIDYTKSCIESILAEAESEDAADDKSEDEPVDKGSSGDKEALVNKLTRRKERAENARDHMAESGDKTACATDLESRVMKTNAGNRPAFNAQAAVDDANHVIVAALITQQNNDSQQMEPVITSVIENTGRKPESATADCGYNSTGTLLFLDQAGIQGYVAEKSDQKNKAEFVYDSANDMMRRPAGPDRVEITLRFHGIRKKDGGTFRVYRDKESGKEMWVSEGPEREMRLRNSMHAKMTSSVGKAIYSLRQQTVEPVFGHLKDVLRLRRLLLRGLEGARIEFLLACAAHNLKKLGRPASVLQSQAVSA